MSGSGLVKRSVQQRDSKGRAIYLSKLPIWKRYPRTFIISGSILIGASVWGYPLYQFFAYNKPEDVPDPQAGWWLSEKRKGKTIVQQYHEKQYKLKVYEEEFNKTKDHSKALKAVYEVEKELRQKAKPSAST